MRDNLTDQYQWQLVDTVVNDQGRWIDPLATAGQAAVDAYRCGQGPAAVA